MRTGSATFASTILVAESDSFSCLHASQRHPGFVRGDIDLAAAFESERLEALGEKWARDRLGDWLNLSPLTRIASQRSFATWDEH